MRIRKEIVCGLFLLIFVTAIPVFVFGSESSSPVEHINLGEVLPAWSCIPFACMLLSIALFPLLAPNIWHHHFGKISAFWALSMAVPFVIA